MSHFHSNMLLGSAGNQGAYEIERSLRFNAGDGAFLHRTPSGAGNQKKYTISLWVKRTAFLASLLDVSFLGAGDGTTYGISGTGAFGSSFDGHVFIRNGGANLGYWDIEFRDPSAWYHFVLAIDTDQSTAANRNRLYVNGVEQPAPSANFGPSASTNINAASIHSIGTFNLPSSATPFAGYFTNGYLAEYNFVDGSQLGPENFGETDTDTGAWIPKKYVGTYGTNGFYLDFSDNSSLSALGTDSSGNGNNWTPVSFSVTAGVDNDSLEDTPTNNWCTLNPLDTDPARTSTVAISNGNLDASVSTYSSVQYVMRTATFASNGKDYFEVRKGDSVSKAVLMGFLEEDGPRSGSTAYAQAYVYSSGNNSTTNSGRVFNTTSATTGYPSTDPGSLGDVIMICHDRANKKIWFGKNGTWFTTGGVVGDPATGTAPAITYTTDKVLLPCIAAASFANTTIRNVNFGQRPFDYTPPTGFEALNAANLPVPTIKNGTEYFTPVLYTGNATARDITVADNQDVAWQPDWVWIKGRPTTSSHTLYDVVRGATKLLSSHNTNAESTDTDTLTSFNTDGFSIGTDVKVNTNSDNYVAWNWKAGGAASTPTQGTIASTASVNAEAGFSIVSYTGNGTAGATIGHGLGVAPSMVIVKNRDRATDWSVWAEPVVDQYGAAYAVFLQATSNAGSYPGVFNSTAPTSTVFSVGTSSSTNFSSEDYIAFCFSEVKSYLKIGKYTGNGSSDGPFVECGFRPSWVMIKRIDNVGNWEIMDNKRLGYNDDNYALRADLGNGEVARSFDILSNGFKIRQNSGLSNHNASGGIYLFMAFSETPFKYANAR